MKISDCTGGIKIALYLLMAAGVVFPFVGWSLLGFTFLGVAFAIVLRLDIRGISGIEHLTIVFSTATCLWAISCLNNGISGAEWIQISTLSTGTLVCSVRVIERAPPWLVLVSIGFWVAAVIQAVLSSLLLQWTLLVTTALVVLLLVVPPKSLQSDVEKVAVLIGAFVGIRATKIVLMGGFWVENTLGVNSAHTKWIMFLSGPVLGVAIFEIARVLVGYATRKES